MTTIDAIKSEGAFKFLAIVKTGSGMDPRSEPTRVVFAHTADGLETKIWGLQMEMVNITFQSAMQHWRKMEVSARAHGEPIPEMPHTPRSENFPVVWQGAIEDAPLTPAVRIALYQHGIQV